MNIFSLFIFGIVLLMYLHIFYQLKTGNDKEIYDVQDITKEKLEEICDLRQPALFNYMNQSIVEKSKEVFMDTEKKYKDMHLNICKSEFDSNENPVILTFENSKKLFNDDMNSNFTTSNNEDFLQKTKMRDILVETDSYLRPPLTSSVNYDICLGSDDSSTPLRYELNYRNFISVITGSVKIKLISPNKSMDLYEHKDYHKFKFSSPINVWNVQSKYKREFDMIEQMEVSVVAGRTLFIPAYWWYSIQYKKNSIVSLSKYRTYMNDLAIAPRLIKRFLQSQNVKHKTVPTINQNEKKKITKTQGINNNHNCNENVNKTPISDSEKTENPEKPKKAEKPKRAEIKDKIK